MKNKLLLYTTCAFLAIFLACAPPSSARVVKNFSTRLKISLNAYSFNKPLLNGTMNLDQLIEFCAANQIDGVDLTAYYFPGYPEVPSDEYLYHIKQKAFLLGVEISGTGVRNDFTASDSEKRKAGIDLVKRWILAAEKLGAPVIRVFSGAPVTGDVTRKEAMERVVAAMKECVDFGKAHGVIVAIQNHNDFIKTVDEAIEILQLINSDWSGLILDIGSYRTGDPYLEIARSIPWTVNWQLKETVFVNGKEQKTDLDKLMKIIKDSGYRGYLPLETLGEGDPMVKVPAFLHEIKAALKKAGE